jgi:hypothetical protein
MRTLRDLFSRLAPPQYTQALSGPQVDKATLDGVLRACGGVVMKPYELDMIVMEFESPASKGALDFEGFDREFKEYLAGKSQLSAPLHRQHNMLQQNFNTYIQSHPVPMGGNTGFGFANSNANKKPLTPIVKEILRKMANLFEYDRSIDLSNVFNRY